MRARACACVRACVYVRACVHRHGCMCAHPRATRGGGGRQGGKEGVDYPSARGRDDGGQFAVLPVQAHRNAPEVAAHDLAKLSYR